jgi:hypothetical protein
MSTHSAILAKPAIFAKVVKHMRNIDFLLSSDSDSAIPAIFAIPSIFAKLAIFENTTKT